MLKEILYRSVGEPSVLQAFDCFQPFAFAGAENSFSDVRVTARRMIWAAKLTILKTETKGTGKKHYRRINLPAGSVPFSIVRHIIFEKDPSIRFSFQKEFLPSISNFRLNHLSIPGNFYDRMLRW